MKKEREDPLGRKNLFLSESKKYLRKPSVGGRKKPNNSEINPIKYYKKILGKKQLVEFFSSEGEISSCSPTI